jgi:hypothetical protein
VACASRQLPPHQNPAVSNAQALPAPTGEGASGHGPRELEPIMHCQHGAHSLEGRLCAL